MRLWLNIFTVTLIVSHQQGFKQFSQNCSSPPKYARKINSPVEASKSQQAQALNIFFSLLIAYPLSGTTEMLKVNCNVFTSWFIMIEFGPQNTVSKLFLKNLFSFSRYRPSKSGTSAGSILGFTRFPKIIIGNLRLWRDQTPWSV